MSYSKSGGAKPKPKSSKKKRPLNAYMKLVVDAKKKNLPSFKYKGSTYKKHTKGHLIYYKKA